MSKYIRTKDNLFEMKNKIVDEINITYLENKCEIRVLYEGDTDIIKQADTIEELCDEFVLIREDGKHHLLRDYDDLSVLKGRTVYAAIWTNKGLIYVAKMNSKGELELL